MLVATCTRNQKQYIEQKKASVSWIICQCYQAKIYPSALWVTLVWSVPYINLHTSKKIQPKHPSYDVQSNTSSCAGKIQKRQFIFTKTSLFTLFWLINSTITSVVYTSYTSVLLRLRLYEPKHILIPTHVEVEILQRAHTVEVKTVLCRLTVKVTLSLKMLLTLKCELNLKLAVNCFCFQRQR